jgi:predicted small secreted protein
MKMFAMMTALLAMGLTSCNTLIGMNRDLRQFSEGMENVAHGRNFDGTEKGQSEEVLPTY